MRLHLCKSNRGLRSGRGKQEGEGIGHISVGACYGLHGVPTVFPWVVISCAADQLHFYLSSCSCNCTCVGVESKRGEHCHAKHGLLLIVRQIGVIMDCLFHYKQKELAMLGGPCILGLTQTIGRWHSKLRTTQLPQSSGNITHYNSTRLCRLRARVLGHSSRGASVCA